MLLRNDDLDRARYRPEYVDAMREDLRWLGLSWDGVMISQSERIHRYRTALEKLHTARLVFPCYRSRRDVLHAAGAPHEGAGDDEPIYPKEFRPAEGAALPGLDEAIGANWRFRVPEDLNISFHDENCGPQHATAGVDFGDFLVWRKDNLPSYQLATVSTLR